MHRGGYDQHNEANSGRLRWAGLIAGPLIALIMLFAGPPEELGATGWYAAAVGVLMATWWMSEALPLPVTALLPLVLFPLAGVESLEQTATSYAHPLIFLFLGGFILAQAMARWQLHRRLAWWVLRLGGTGPTAIVGGIMAATAFLSMWVSNTATAMVMLPIGQSIVATMAAGGTGSANDPSRIETNQFSAALMLGIAYAATIGGMGTLIGTPPNALFAGFLQEAYGIEIGFADWMLIGVPTVLILLPIAWLVLTRISFQVSRSTDSGLSMDGLTRPGPISRQEICVATVMVVVALAWMFRPLLARLLPGLPLSDAGIAITGAIAMFAIPAGPTTESKSGSMPRQSLFLLEWKDLRDLRWDVLILFGGGLALASAIGETGLSSWIGGLVADLQTLPRWLMVLLVMVVVVYLGELASNTAMAALFLPVAAAAAIGMGDSPLALALPVALAASLGFMLPVATPPNAIVFGSGSIDVKDMLRAGAILDVVCIVIVAIIALTLGPLVFAG